MQLALAVCLKHIGCNFILHSDITRNAVLVELDFHFCILGALVQPVRVVRNCHPQIISLVGVVPRREKDGAEGSAEKGYQFFHSCEYNKKS